MPFKKKSTVYSINDSMYMPLNVYPNRYSLRIESSGIYGNVIRIFLSNFVPISVMKFLQLNLS